MKGSTENHAFTARVTSDGEVIPELYKQCGKYVQASFNCMAMEKVFAKNNMT